MRHLPTAAALVAGCCLGLSACSGGSPSAATTTSAPTTTTPTAKVTAAPCPASSVSASVVFTAFGGANSTLAGAVLFTNTGSAPCSLKGEPQVDVLAPDGSGIVTYQAPGPPTVTAAVLTPASKAASSITFSDWACGIGSFSLVAKFPGWATSIPVGSGAGSTTSTTAAGPPTTTPLPCTQQRETGQTIYIGPVTSVTT